MSSIKGAVIDNNSCVMDDDDIVRLATELVDAVDNNWLVDKDKIAKYKYAHLVAMFLATAKLSGGDRLYKYCYDAVIRYGEERIRRKINSGEKIKVAYLPISASEWPAEKIYRLMENSDIFEPVIIPIPLIGRSKDERGRTYDQTYQFFAENSYNIKKVYDSETEEIIGWAQVGLDPDIVIHVTPWYLDVAKEYQITELPVHVLNIYISYGINTGDSVSEEFEKQCIFNKEFSNMMWRIYTETERDYEGYCKYGLLAGSNIRVSGYTKMDYFRKHHEYDNAELAKMWKVPDGQNVADYKKVIIAPHYSVGDKNLLSFSTFDSNMYFFPYLIEKYKDKVSFVFKPHPNLRNSLIVNGYMKSIDEYERYLDLYKKLPNASVQEEGDYLALFETSDAMIEDSISFIGEYYYVNKPMLFLERPEQRLTSLGTELMKGQYTANGKDYMAIDTYVRDVVIDERDWKKDMREAIYERELDYVRINGMSAYEYIYNDITSSINMK